MQGGAGSVPGLGAKVPDAQAKEPDIKQYCNKFNKDYNGPLKKNLKKRLREE